MDFGEVGLGLGCFFKSCEGIVGSAFFVWIMYCKSTVLLWVPFFVLLASAGCDDVAGVLWVGLDLKPVITQVTFTSEGEDRRRVIVAYFLLLGVVTDAHPNVVVTSTAPDVER